MTVILVEMHLPLAAALRWPLAFGPAAILGALSVGWLMLQLGSRATMLLLSFLTGAGGIGIAAAILLLPIGPTLFEGIFAGLIILGFCMGGMNAGLLALATSVYTTQTRAAGVGIVAVTGRVGAILSSFVGGAILTIAHASGFFGLIVALAIVVVGGVLLVDRHLPRLSVRTATSAAALSPVD